jgi:endogenous inhibitor of DNA gyrase (YacG/DUF329 family)
MPRVAASPGPLLAPPPFGQLGVLEALPDGSGVRCHLCGGYFRFLGKHVSMAHSLAADAYRERFGLNRRTSLAAESFRAVLRAHAIRRDTVRLLRLGGPGPSTVRRLPPMRLQTRLERRRTWGARRDNQSRVEVSCSRCGAPVERLAMHRNQPATCATCKAARHREVARESKRRRKGAKAPP